MKAIIEIIVWVALNAVGGWLVAVNLFQVGRLGAAAVGFFLLFVAWAWLAWVIVAMVGKRLSAQRAAR